MHSEMDILVTIQDGGLAISTKLWAHKIHSPRFNKILVLHNWNHNETTFLLLADRSRQKLLLNVDRKCCIHLYSATM